ncbi:DUF3305 domain-containing protein [Undibacterium sp. CCC2.1]|uniref:DUF3305 domain-containing protein n=2 Tax=unclassified Undibacterium TaxID=2630295 RepID=UPI002B22D2C9|nr:MULTISPECIES: DUF3305 domain-containing protein [unclassified Undibacterium]MEB0141026.1 DUF3305 domain-containing protein [Undibacterium sp. CCC2.1]MEB0174018.1 DUF3305 domain-containing protein [Undibacterium sp. CCC1.1]MEB0177974.1 DUF3305 domain-containing protein [Undibacterium sp. CCC3.4]
MMEKHSVLPFTLAVLMQRVALNNRWQAYRWKPLEILADAQPGGARVLIAGEAEQRWLFPGFAVHLHADETPGYFLNLSSATPCWFVMWRLEEMDGQEVAVPKSLTLSYDEAARQVDGGEQVDTLPLADEVAAWLAEYTQQHFQYEGKKKRKRPSFEGGEAVQKMAQAETAVVLPITQGQR